MPIPDDQNTQKPQKSGYLKGFLVATILFGVITAIYFSKNTPQNNHPSAPNTAITTEESEQLIQGSVVHIDCPLADGSGDQLGSGTIINSGGLVLTNAHVIPHDDSYLNTSPEGCYIYIPDPKTGMVLIDKSYLAKPKIIKEIGAKYDLATLQIYEVVGDSVTQKIKTLPSKFPSFDITKGCSIQDLKLGDKIHIYGYPNTGGNGLGLSLTITDGIVSSFPGDGYIVTNAIINHGNSGGLAINDKGCFIGIPEEVYKGDLANYGYIISTDLINKYNIESSKKPIELRDESEKTRVLSRPNVEQYYESAPYYINFKDLTEKGSKTKLIAGLSDKFIIMTLGNNDEDLDAASIAATVTKDDQLSFEKAFYVMTEFTNVIDNRILATDKEFILNMMQEMAADPNETKTKNINNFKVTMSISEEDKAIILIFEATK